MKRMKVILCLCLLLCLLLTGCGLFETEGTEDDEYTGTYFPVSDYAGQIGGEGSNGAAEQSVVKTVRSYAGEIAYTYPVENYSYRLPMIDLAGEQAAGCNQEIEERFGTLIDQSLEAIEELGDPLILTLSFTSYTRDDILTLRIDCVDFDGDTSRAFYTVDARNGDAVPIKTLFAAAGLDGDPEQLVEKAVEELFTRRFGPLDKNDTAYTTALSRTQNALLPLEARRMHRTEDGRLIVAIELFWPNGASSVEELILP